MTLVTIVALSCITFLCRYLFLLPGLPLRLGKSMETFLGYSAPAVLTAIWVPIIFVHDGLLNTNIGNPYLWGAVVATVVSIKTKSVYLTLAASVVMFVVLRFQLIQLIG
jgi:branched-subunit amino acid transport protein